MLLLTDPLADDPLRQNISNAYLANEAKCLEKLLARARIDDRTSLQVQDLARHLVSRVRSRGRQSGVMEAFVQEYGLSTPEGVVLMCLAESLLRIPDAATADQLIQDKLSPANWAAHLGHSDSLWVNASTWGLMLSGRLLRQEEFQAANPMSVLTGLLARSSEPLIRSAVKQAMGIMAHQFVMGRTIADAWQRSRELAAGGNQCSFDMLGEAAYTTADAQRYHTAYQEAISHLQAVTGKAPNVFTAPGISVKLSALHPRYQYAQYQRVLAELPERLLGLALSARQANIGLTIDAEEAERLDLSLDVFQRVFSDPRLADWEGLGLAVQTYQKRALPVLEWLLALSERHRKRIPVRLVKGAYWDTEIKRAQEQGLADYPVFTRKASTDVSFLACARFIWAQRSHFYAQFATHNAHTIAYVLQLTAGSSDFEFQRLHGMGAALYQEVAAPPYQARCRVYAPVGSHEDLLPYLVRRLLENGANTSFVHRIEDHALAVDSIVADPVARVAKLFDKPHPRIPLPRHLYAPARVNAMGVHLNDPAEIGEFRELLLAAAQRTWLAAPIIAGKSFFDREQTCFSPGDLGYEIGAVVHASAPHVALALQAARKAFPAWSRLPAGKRAAILLRAADLLERHLSELVYLCVAEAGRTVADAVAEVREAVDFCRYYAVEMRDKWAVPQILPGPTGERNLLSYHGRGVFYCISPWNFPIALFTGQVAAALVTGNCVIAKPATATPLCAYLVTKLLYDAGVPPEVLHFLPGSSGELGEKLLMAEGVDGVAFTGSFASAKNIQGVLARRPGAIIPLIAETGGINAMIADSSALPEQLVMDVLRSAFNSAGQRCSALRILMVQEDIAARVVDMLAGATAELRVGDPRWLSTDIGPVIDHESREQIQSYLQQLPGAARILYQGVMAADLPTGYYVAPSIVELPDISHLKKEVFGPVLHVVRFKHKQMKQVIESVNNTGYGLTLGIHSRISRTVDDIVHGAHIGNIYVNRNMVGAVVGAQPFGGEGRSGTGFKAGGPNYLLRFMVERTLSNNITATGGNATLLSLGE